MQDAGGERDATTTPGCRCDGSRAAERLSPREDETLALLLTGAPEKVIAAKLGVSNNTAHEYVKVVYRKLRVSSRAELIASVLPRESRSPDGLSPRERETLSLLRTGASEKAIAASLGVSAHTAHEYVKGVYRKLGVTSRVELMARALADGPSSG